VVKPNVAIAIPDLVGESFDLFGDGGCTAIVAKVGGGAAVVGGGGVLKPFPGAEGLDWRSSKNWCWGFGQVPGGWRLLERVFPGVCLFWCTHMQRRGFKTTTKYGRGEELASLLQVGHRRWLCQGQALYG
jgi:hypothetical protein